MKPNLSGKLSFILILIAFSVNAQQLNLDSLQQTRQEYYFQLELNDSKQLHDFSRLFSIDQIQNDQLIGYANPTQYEILLQLGYKPQLLMPPGILDEEPRMLQAWELKQRNRNWDYYPTYEAYEQLMFDFADAYPDLCSIYTIGTLNSGRRLLAARINNGETAGKPEFLYTATIHGDETTGYILMLRLIEYLLENYGSDNRITELVDNIDIWINPLANPNGTYWGGNHTVNGSRRGNANNIDLNRNYPDPEDGPHPDGNAWQEETVYFMDFAEERRFIMSSNFHGGAEVINYPYDTWQRFHADHDWWYFVSREYADTAQYHSPYGYLTDYDNGIVQGYEWYSISGGRQDYMNYFQACRECTMEISYIKTLPPSQLPNLWEYNYRSLLNYLEQSTYGFHGTVTDSISGEPIRAKIEILDHDYDNSFVYSFLPSGDFHRLIKAGTYDLTFTAEGYYPKTLYNLSIEDYQRIDLEVKMLPGIIIADFTASEYDVAKGGSVDFFDASYGQDIISWDWHFAGGEPPVSSLQNPENITYHQVGEYDVTLIITNLQGESDTICKQDLIKVAAHYNMTQGVFYTCEGVFYDPGGKDGNYGNNLDIVTTFFPDTEKALMKVEFQMFDVEYNANCNWDWLKIYDGPDTQSPLLGTYCGTDSPGTIIADNPYGALTFQFHSDYSVNKAGWEAHMSCHSTVGLAEKDENDLRIFPNPNRGDALFIHSVHPIELIEIMDVNGSLLLKMDGEFKCIMDINTSRLSKAVYIMRIRHTAGIETRKLLIE